MAAVMGIASVQSEGRDDTMVVFEPRGPAWSADAADRLCRRLHLLRGGDPFTLPAPRPRVQPIAYFRLHGLGGYRYAFTDADLCWLARLVRGSQQRPRPVLGAVEGGERAKGDEEPSP